jgi:hypothetical protein
VDIENGGHRDPELSVNQQKSVVMQRSVLKGQNAKRVQLRSAGRIFIKDDKEKHTIRSNKY